MNLDKKTLEKLDELKEKELENQKRLKCYESLKRLKKWKEQEKQKQY